jgi:SAM-dependent methyltransferase
MRFRIALARFLLRAGGFLRMLPVVVLRPADMVDWSRQAYERGSRAYRIANDVDDGLTPDELEMWQRVPVRAGRVLILGGGGGREAVWFARQGWQVAAVDFSAQMLEQARESMAQRQFAFEGWGGDIARLDARRESFDLVWVSMFLYSVVVNRQRRLEMLRRIRQSLKPGGVLVVSFHWQPNARRGSKAVLALKAIAWLMLGNTRFENGDILFGTIEFRHAFSAAQDLQAEFDAGGFETLHLTVSNGMMRGGAVLRKCVT